MRQTVQVGIVVREDVSGATFPLSVHLLMVAGAAPSGKFVVMFPHTHGKRIPPTIAVHDREKSREC